MYLPVEAFKRYRSHFAALTHTSKIIIGQSISHVFIPTFIEQLIAYVLVPWSLIRHQLKISEPYSIKSIYLSVSSTFLKYLNVIIYLILIIIIYLILKLFELLIQKILFKILIISKAKKLIISWTDSLNG